MSSEQNCNQLISSDTMDLVKETWAKVGTMLLVSHVLEIYIQKNGEGLMNQKWVQASLFTLVGFTVYDVVVKKMVHIHMDNKDLEVAVNNAVNVGTMLTVSRVLEGLMGPSKTINLDEEWMKSSLYTILGFAAYDLVTKKFVPDVSAKYSVALHTISQFATMFVVSRLLANKPIDEQYIRSSGYVLAGFAAYDMVVGPMLVKKDIVSELN